MKQICTFPRQKYADNAGSNPDVVKFILQIKKKNRYLFLTPEIFYGYFTHLYPFSALHYNDIATLYA